jgi:phenylalanyl-tRNA synthetase beta chain
VRVPLSWLREFVEITLPLPELANRLTMAGLEVEDVDTLGAVWRDVAIARVTDLEPHPRADSLFIARLDRGGRTATVVTAATNLRVGAHVPHVAPGGRVPGGEVGTRTFQGVTSEGMVCSGDELGLSPDKDGIYLLEDEAAVGQPLAEYLDETVLDIYITPNRPDCMSIVGIAREVHALTGALFRLPQAEPPHGKTPAGELVAVRIEDPVGCPRFAAAVVQGVTINPSPHRFQRRLYLAGVRPINNVVDITNYVMLELGQPLHAFDRQRLHGTTIVVRRATPGERLVTLDGTERALAPEMLVVADERGARSLAGIMGGLDSEIVPGTREVVLEGANWDRATIRLTASALGLSSEASRRFGRGVDPDLTALAVSRATALTLELAGGSAAAGLVDVYPGRGAPRVVPVRPAQIEALLGAPYPRDRVVTALAALGFGVEDRGEELAVSVPGHRRFDVEHRADLAEEVARVVGYESIPATLPAGRLPEPRPEGDAGYADEQRARRALAAAGLHEVITYSLVDPAQVAKLDADAPWPPTETGSWGVHETVGGANGLMPVANPMSAEQSLLRPTLLGSLLDAVRANLRHRARVLLFELARTWRGPLGRRADGLPDERRHVAIALVGPRAAAHWSASPDNLDFFDLKGVVDALCAAFSVRPAYLPARHATLHPGRTARVGAADHDLGVLGQVHPRVAERFDLEDRAVLVAELDFERLLQARRPLEKAAAPPRFPPAERDIALVVDEAVAHAPLAAAIREAGAPLLTQARLFDVYQGAPIPPGRKSLAYALTYQAPDRTLADDEVASVHACVEEAVRRRFGAAIRGR